MTVKKYFVYIAILLQLGILLSIFISRQVIFMTGTEIKLRSTLYDPRDIFYGDYANLSFAINRFVNKENINVQNGQKVYALLKNKNDDWVVDSISLQKPQNGVFLKGKVISEYGGIMNLEYGFEKYFVEQGKGRDLEKKIQNTLNNSEMTAYLIIVVNNSGNAVVKDLVFEEATPTQKGEALDLDRIRDFGNLRYAIEGYYGTKGKFPKSVLELNISMDDMIDPESRMPYDIFEISENSYKLCATFSTEQEDIQPMVASDNRVSVAHDKGYDCIQYPIPDFIVDEARTKISPTVIPEVTITVRPLIFQ